MIPSSRLVEPRARRRFDNLDVYCHNAKFADADRSDEANSSENMQMRPHFSGARQGAHLAELEK